MGAPVVGHQIVTTSDLGAVEAALRAGDGSAVVLEQLGQGVDLDARHKVFCLGQSQVAFLRFGAPMRISLAGMSAYRVVIPLEGHAGVRVSGRGSLRVNPQTGIVVSTEAGVELVCASGYSHLAVSFPQDVLHRELERLTGTTVTAPIEFSERLDLTTSATSLWRHLLRAIDVSAEQVNGTLARGLPLRRLERRLLMLLLTEQPHSHSRNLQQPQIGIVQRAIDRIEDQPNHRWTVDELAATVWCSVRTLQAGFHKTVGITPTEYVRWVRLQRVHDELKNATSSHATVTTIATSWGFAHMGRFSAAYHEEFREYPHETLRDVSRMTDADSLR
jgi:AraC-like DNA-binding protein